MTRERTITIPASGPAKPVYSEADLVRAVRGARRVDPDWVGTLAPDGSSMYLYRAGDAGTDWLDQFIDKGAVYFVACGPYVKIGYTNGPIENRLDSFKTANPFPLHVCLTVPAKDHPENLLHRKFAEHRHAREWFHLADAIKQFILENGGTLP